jgi:hypothetical protein
MMIDSRQLTSSGTTFGTELGGGNSRLLSDFKKQQFSGPGQQFVLHGILSFVICHLSFVVCHLSFVICHLSFGATTNDQQPMTNNQ